MTDNDKEVTLSAFMRELFPPEPKAEKPKRVWVKFRKFEGDH